MPEIPGAGEEAAAARKNVSWTVPAGWQEQPGSAMRVGSFLIKGANGQTTDVSIVSLGGDAGGDLGNINRWRGQIGLTPLSAEQLSHEMKPQTFGGLKMHWVDFANQGKRITAAIYKRGQQTWFFKMTGDDETTRGAQDAMRQFLASLRFR
jgi:hypothetical protein